MVPISCYGIWQRPKYGAGTKLAYWYPSFKFKVPSLALGEGSGFTEFTTDHKLVSSFSDNTIGDSSLPEETTSSDSTGSVLSALMRVMGTTQSGTVILCATPYRNSDPGSPFTHVHFQDPCFVSVTFLFSILTLTLDSVLGTLYARPCPTLPVPCPLSIYPDQGFCNPLSDLLIPPLCSQPCIVPSSYKSKPPMYSRPSLNIDQVSYQVPD